MSYFEEHESCPCPAGVHERTELAVETSKFTILFLTAAAAIYAVGSFVKWLASLDWAMIAQTTLIVVGLSLGTLAAGLWMITVVADIHNGVCPPAFRPFKWAFQGVSRRIRRFFYERELIRQMRAMPELARLSQRDVKILERQEDHHVDERIRDPELVQAWRVAFSEAQLRTLAREMSQN